MIKLYSRVTIMKINLNILKMLWHLTHVIHILDVLIYHFINKQVIFYHFESCQQCTIIKTPCVKLNGAMNPVN